MAVADELDLVEDEAEDWRVSVMFEWGRTVGHTWGGVTALAVVFGLIVWWSEHLPRIAVHCDASVWIPMLQHVQLTTAEPQHEVRASKHQHAARNTKQDRRMVIRVTPGDPTRPHLLRTGQQRTDGRVAHMQVLFHQRSVVSCRDWSESSPNNCICRVWRDELVVREGGVCSLAWEARW